MMKHTTVIRALVLSLISLSGCSTTLLDLGPDYRPPDPEAPEQFLNAETSSQVPLTDDWWNRYQEPRLARLIGQALEHNQDLAAAASRVDQARAIAGEARSERFPHLAAEATALREQSQQTARQAADYVRLNGLLSYELDLWGAVRSRSEAAQAEADSAALRLEAARVSLSALVAETFFLARASRHEEQIIASTLETRREALRVIDAQHEEGFATDLDLARAQRELSLVEAEHAAATRRSHELAHALALLCGEAAPAFRLPTELRPLPDPPAIPAGLPSAILRNRPDIAASERALQAASERIGVARAAFLPNIQLTGMAGWESDELDATFSGGSERWSIGPQLYLPLLDGGRNRARLAHAFAEYEVREADFRQSVLVAFREVQDALTASRFLSEQENASERTVLAAHRASELSRERYDAGHVSYLEVVDSERVALAAELARTQLRAQRLVASIQLIRALGGGWSHGNALPPAEASPLQSASTR